ncbi:MOCOS [Symbiodinium natans]|uniref:MOCOS protein n=1 Tax=Symbiodinium natans TaxID=878477 RepID=A0A812SEM8_9DINO|nr:MOCOS [Symbiodinium natans]
MFYNNAIGRVSWQAGEVWDEALESIAPALEALSVAIQEVLQSTDMRSPFLGGGVSKKLRRAVLDSAAWSRDLLVVLVGHFHGAVRVKSNMLTCRDSLSLSPSNFTSDAAFKAAVKEAALREQNRAANTYSFLRQKDRAQSERFLSSFFNKASEFQIALLDESSGEPLSHEAMLDLLVEDMMSRASNDFPADARSLQETDLLVSDVRSRGGFDLHDDSWSEPIQDSFYTLEELDDVLQKCHSSKKCLHGCFSLLKSSQSSHRKVVLGLANLSRHVGLTSSLWSLRQFAHIRKSGARIVRKVQCLRPISLVADMAHVIDGLWLARNRSKLESFAGPNQVGGVSATNLLLLAILLLAQARDYQGLPLYLAILDLRWAFDVARLSSMKLACFQAGVRGTDWLLLDDVLDSDRQYVQLHGFLSHVFRLGCGIAQGRRFSVHVFNSLLSWLRDEIQQVTAANTSAWLPKYAIRALAHVDLEASHVDFYSRPSPVDALEPCVSRLQELMANAQFNYGKNKTCAMALLNSPPLDHEALDCDVVDQKHILGVLFDSQLTFLPLLSQSLARGWSMFVDLFHTAETGGFSVPVLSSQVQIRLHPVVLHAAPFLVGVAGIKENSVNTLYSHSVAGICVWEAVCFLKSL